MTTIPAAVAAALAHVRQFHPEVTQVFFGTDHRWLYCSEAFEAPTFGTGIDVSILEAAADAVTLVPAAFTLEVGATPDHHDSDGTGYAHPAFWRGNDYALQVMVGKIEEILDGKDKGEGTANDPWETARRRLIKLVAAREAVLTLCAEAFCHDPMGQEALNQLETKIKAAYGLGG